MAMPRPYTPIKPAHSVRSIAREKRYDRLFGIARVRPQEKPAEQPTRPVYDVTDMSDHNVGCPCGNGGKRVYCSRCGEDGNVFLLPSTGEHLHPDPCCHTPEEWDEMMLAVLPEHADCSRMVGQGEPDYEDAVYETAEVCMNAAYITEAGVGHLPGHEALP